MMYLTLTIAIIAIFFSRKTYTDLQHEKKRNRIIQSFMAGIIRTISDYRSQTDSISPEYIPESPKKIPIPYNMVIENIQYEFSKDFGIEKYEEWLKNDRGIFNDNTYGGDGFNFIYLDFFDKLDKQWNSGELISEIDKEYLDSTTIVTKDNLDELEGEIAMYKDLLSGSLDISGFSIENIDSKINSIFPNIKTECKEVIKKALIKRIKDINKS